MKVLKKYKTAPGKYQYILFDTKREVKRTMSRTPGQILHLCNKYDIERISEAQARPFMGFTELDINEFWELPF